MGTNVSEERGPWKLRKHFGWRRWYQFTKLHVVTSQNRISLVVINAIVWHTIVSMCVYHDIRKTNVCAPKLFWESWVELSNFIPNAYSSYEDAFCFENLILVNFSILKLYYKFMSYRRGDHSTQTKSGDAAIVSPVWVFWNRCHHHIITHAATDSIKIAIETQSTIT